MPEVSVTDTGDAIARDGAAAVTGLSGPAPEPGTSVHISHTGSATAAAGGNANTGYQHIENLYVVQPSVPDPPPPPAPQIPGWAVPRIDELEEIISAVLAQPGGAVGITTGLEGAGGFGKTMLAEMVCADEDVRRHFEGRIYVVTIGRDVREPAAIAAKVIETIRFITGHTATYTDPSMAGDELGRLLDQRPGRRILLVLDDVWEPAQLDPFLRGGKDCMRLITTRVPAVLPGSAARVRVDQMTQDQARAVLGQDLPALPEHLARDLITATGRWPLLLRLANRWMWRQTQAGADIATAAGHMLTLLREEGPAAVGRPRPPPDPADPAQRGRLVRATLQAATGLLASGEQQRLAELGIFAEDEPVPVLVATRLWQATAGISEPRSRDLCYELGSLSLLTVNPDGGGFLILHDVIRDYLRHELGSDRITALNAALTDAIQDDLPPAAPLAASAPGSYAAWWTLAENPDSTPAASYLADHAISHLLAAARAEQAEAVAGDLRWVEARLRQHGPTAPWSDCTRIPTADAARRARDLAQAAHLLAPADPGDALTAVLHSRLGPLPRWRDQISARLPLAGPAIRNHWTPPDLPHSALLRALPAHRFGVSAMAGARDSVWLATADLVDIEDDGVVRIWDPTTGKQTTTLIGHRGRVTHIAIAPDGDWLVTAGGEDRTVRFWDRATGTQTGTLTGYSRGVTGIAIAPDGGWLAIAGYDGTVRIWNRATGAFTRTLAAHTEAVSAVAIAGDGTWLATASGLDRTVRFWDPTTAAQIGSLEGPARGVTALAIAPDATWLATISGDSEGTIRIWDRATGTLTRTFAGGRRVESALAIAPDGTWLATGDYGDGTIRIWDPATGIQATAIAGHTPQLTGMVVAPDATWLAASSILDGTVRIWDPAADVRTANLTSQAGRVSALGIAPDGRWLASGDAFDTKVRILDTTTGEQTATLTGCTGRVSALAIAPDGKWLAVGDFNGKVRIYDQTTGALTRTLTGSTSHVSALAINPDGKWLAVGDGLDGRVRIWSPDTGKQTCNPIDPIIPIAHVSALAIAPDGKWLAVGYDAVYDSEDDRYDYRLVQIWDPATRSRISILSGKTDDVSALATASDGRRLAVGGGRDGRVEIWDPATSTLINTLTGHTRQVTALTATPDGTLLATAAYDRTVRIWDMVTGQAVTMMRTDTVPRSCAWMPDGAGLVAGSEHGVHFFEFYPR